MRILYISHTHPPKGAILDNVGGMQRVSYQLIRELRQRSDITLHTETINVAGRGVVAVQTIWFLVKMLFTLPAKAKKFEADIVLFSSMVTALLAYFLRDRLNVPLVAINHGRDVTLQVGIYQRIVPNIFSSLNGVISVSRATRKQCIKRGMDPRKGVALPNGIDLDVTQVPDKVDSRSALEKEFKIPLSGKKMLLTVGRKVERKGDRWFIENVLPKLSADVVYVTIGEGPELDSVKKAAKRSLENENIFILGRQPEHILQQAYAASDLFVMPNIPVEGDMEGFGIVLLEANIAETPAVAADLEGIKDVITDGKNGYKVPPQDAQKIVLKIDQVLKNDLKPLSKSSRRYVQEQFGWQQVAERYICYLRQVRNDTKKIRIN